ncbi:MAG: transposase [Verrucomicrobiota bacterium]
MLRDMGIEGLPGEKVFWEDLGRFGTADVLAALNKTTAYAAKRTLMKIEPEDIQIGHGFIPLFGDGTLLEGSPNREGTKYIKEKGSGLMWGTWMLGPMVAGQHLCAEGEGEHRAQGCTRNDVLRRVVDPLGWRSRTLVLMDSLHGDDPTLGWLEEERLHGIIGGNKLAAVKQRLENLPDSGWKKVPEKQMQKGFVEEQACTVYIQCEEWEKKRRLVGKRFKRDGELMWNYSGVFCNIPPIRLGTREETDMDYQLKVWKLYSLKMGMEDRFKDLLIDLAGHRPPCQGLEKNRGYYALLSLAHNLARAVDLIGGAQRRRALRKQGKRTNQRMRIATLRRHLFALPGFITVHARKVTIRLIGGGGANLGWFGEYWGILLARC